jgi:hypothetical protein
MQRSLGGKHCCTAVWLHTLTPTPPPSSAATTTNIPIARLSPTVPPSGSAGQSVQSRMETCSLTRADYRSEASRGKGEPFFLIRHGISSVQSSTSLAIAHTRTNAFAATCAVPELRLPHGPLSCDLNPVPFDYHPPRASTRGGAKWLMKSRLHKAQ